MKILRTRDVKMPTRGTGLSAGIDFYVPNDYIDQSDPYSRSANSYVRLRPGEDALIPSGIVANVPDGYVLVAFNKSGVATKGKLAVGACVVDEDYTGEIHIHVFNYGLEEKIVRAGEKLVQFLLLPACYDAIEEAEDMYSLFAGKNSERGSGGFGSTGDGLSGNEQTGEHYTHIEELNQVDPNGTI